MRSKAPVLLLAATLLLLNIPGAPTTAGPVPTTLQVTPEMDRNPVTEIHRLTARVSPVPDGGVEVDFKILSGPNASSKDRADNVTAMTQPDMFCTVRAGESSCFVELGPSRGVGTDEIIAWIDTDGENITVEGDKTEAPDAGGGPEEPDCPEQNCGADGQGEPGGTAEPDATDSVKKMWGQLGASRPPFIDGRTEEVGFACDKQRKRVDGETVAVAKGCSFAYLVAESNDASDYAVLWAQSSIDPKRGWCARRLTTEITAPLYTEAIEIGPSSDRNIGRTRALTTGLVGGPQDATDEGAYFEQQYLAYRGDLAATGGPGDAVGSLEWEGDTKQAVAHAFGMEISWDASGAFPDLPAPTTLGYRVTRC